MNEFPQALELLKQGDLDKRARLRKAKIWPVRSTKGDQLLSGMAANMEQSLAYSKKAPKAHSWRLRVSNTHQRCIVSIFLAQLEQNDLPELAEARRHQAAGLREEVIPTLPDLANERTHTFLKQQWWFGATLAEACFGLGRLPKPGIGSARRSPCNPRIGNSKAPPANGCTRTCAGFDDRCGELLMGEPSVSSWVNPFRHSRPFGWGSGIGAVWW